MESPIISVNNISIIYEKEEVIKDLSFQIKKGEKAVITGESGKGKSTILNSLLGFVPISNGEIFISDKKLVPDNILEIRNKVAWLPQETSLDFQNVNDIIYTPFTFKSNKHNFPSNSEVDQILNSLNISSKLLQNEIDEISGGQKQRILLASSLLLKKDILIIDEPTSALDTENKKQITDFVMSQNNLTVLAVTHDIYWIEQSDKIIAL
ncbi:MAG: ATP-binding cassette domain-containing protein [Bacteroidota bacterium]